MFHRILVALATLLLTAPTVFPQFREVSPELQRNHPNFVAAFRDAVKGPSKGTVRVLCDDKETALGMVVGPDGWVLTKANDLKGTISCKLPDGRTFDAKIMGLHAEHDLAVLKIPVRGLTPVEFKSSQTTTAGHWVACAGLTEEPVAVGIVSVATRTVPSKVAANEYGYLGLAVEMMENGLQITQVVPDTPAAKVGLKTQDLLLSLQGQTLSSSDAFVDLMQKQKVGEVVTLRIKRGQEELQLKATLVRRPAHHTRGDFQNRMGSELSSRTSGYATILQHDAVIRPKDCGGPVVDLEGKVIGINICRAGRTESWAIPTEVIHSLLPELMSGRLSPTPEVPARSMNRVRP